MYHVLSILVCNPMFCSSPDFALARSTLGCSSWIDRSAAFEGQPKNLFSRHDAGEAPLYFIVGLAVQSRGSQVFVGLHMDVMAHSRLPNVHSTVTGLMHVHSSVQCGSMQAGEEQELSLEAGLDLVRQMGGNTDEAMNNAGAFRDR